MTARQSSRPILMVEQEVRTSADGDPLGNQRHHRQRRAGAVLQLPAAPSTRVAPVAGILSRWAMHSMAILCVFAISVLVA